MVDFVATTRPPGQKGRRRTLRLPSNHSIEAAFGQPFFEDEAYKAEDAFIEQKKKEGKL